MSLTAHARCQASRDTFAFGYKRRAFSQKLIYSWISRCRLIRWQECRAATEGIVGGSDNSTFRPRKTLFMSSSSKAVNNREFVSRIFARRKGRTEEVAGWLAHRLLEDMQQSSDGVRICPPVKKQSQLDTELPSTILQMHLLADDYLSCCLQKCRRRCKGK